MKKALIVAAFAALAIPAMAQNAAPSNRFAEAIAPAEKFNVGVLEVQRFGEHGSPVILMPGLATGPWVWQDMVRRLKGDHVLYVAALPYDSRTATAGEAMGAALQSLNDLVTSRKVARPLLVGHSLGGTLALAFAQQYPATLSGVVAIDGLPVFPGTENMPAPQRAQLAGGMRARVGSATPQAFAAQQQAFMRSSGSIDMSKADDLAALTARSDPRAVGNVMASALALDLRPGLGRITVPVLEIVPYFDADDMQNNLTQPMKLEYYKSLLAGTPKLELLAVAPSRHFAIVDQPQQVEDAIRAFIKVVNP